MALSTESSQLRKARVRKLLFRLEICRARCAVRRLRWLLDLPEPLTYAQSRAVYADLDFAVKELARLTAMERSADAMVRYHRDVSSVRAAQSLKK